MYKCALGWFALADGHRQRGKAGVGRVLGRLSQSTCRACTADLRGAEQRARLRFLGEAKNTPSVLGGVLALDNVIFPLV